MKALILLSSLGVISLCAEIFRFKKFLFPIIFIGLIGTAVMAISEWGHGNVYYYMMKFDSYAVVFTVAITTIAFLWFLMSQSYIKEQTGITDHVALICFSLVGALVMVSYNNLTMLFLGIEILSIPMYVLAGGRKNNLGSNEASFKYFLMGAFATGFLLFGIALIYGSSGSFDLGKIAAYVSTHQNNVSGLFYAGILLMLIGLAFKVSVAPFHFWVPDVYQGAPTVITAFMATLVKTAAFAAFFRLFYTCFASVNEIWVSILSMMVVLTMIIGNVTAVYQNSVKRMLAYSSISHAGYMLMAIVAMNAISANSIVYYTAAYSVSTIAAFAVLYLVSNSKENDLVEAFNGLSKKNPFLAFVMTVALLSLAGIPPTAGFFAKYYIFSGAIQSQHIGLVIVALLGSAIGVYYYFRIIIAMYFKHADETPSISIEPTYKLLLILVTLAAIVFGIFPEIIIGWLR